jgi:predicted nucleic acid-binding protein
VRCLLDSMLLIDHANGDAAATALLQRLFEEGQDLYTCDVVTCEALSKGDAEQLAAMRTLLDALEYVATSPDAASWAGESRRLRHSAGRRRALGDALIAGAANSIGASVVTRNQADFDLQGIPTITY